MRVGRSGRGGLAGAFLHRRHGDINSLLRGAIVGVQNRCPEERAGMTPNCQVGRLAPARWETFYK